jgi:hypothetical protein
MYLYVHELKAATLSQKITIGSKNIDLYAIRPHFYRHLNPSGSIVLNLADANGNIIKQSETISIASLGSGSYWHGYYRMLISAQLKANTNYYIQLVAKNGYAFDPNAYVGWCNDFDFRRVTADYSPNTGDRAAIDLELWGYENLLRRN